MYTHVRRDQSFINLQYGTGRDGTGRDGTGRDGTGPGRDRDGTGRDGTGRDGTGRDGTGRDGTGRDGTGRDGTGRDGTGTDGLFSILLSPKDILSRNSTGIAFITDACRPLARNTCLIFCSDKPVLFELVV